MIVFTFDILLNVFYWFDIATNLHLFSMAREKTGVKNRREKSGVKKDETRSKVQPVQSETAKSSRKTEVSLSRILSQISHPQMPHESLQPWSETFFSLFIFIYLLDALWGQHIYMYKERVLHFLYRENGV